MLRRILAPALGLLVVGAFLMAGTGAAAAATTSANLISNGKAEAALGHPVPGWTTQVGAGFGAYRYGVDGSPSFTDPGPANRGAALFEGGWPPIGVDERLAAASQTKALSAFRTSIDAGTATYTLVGWLGGYNDQRDDATLEVHFLCKNDVVLGAVMIGPVTPGDRGQLRGLLKRTAKAAVPVGARKALITLSLRRFDGGYNDGYADNLSLTITTR